MAADISRPSGTLSPHQHYGARDVVTTRGTNSVEHLRLSWPADPDLLNVVRDTVHTWLATLALSIDEVTSMVVAVDAALDNAIGHAYQPGRVASVDLALWTEPNMMCIEIIDYGAWRHSAKDSPAGGGISLMKTLVETVLIRSDEHGTRVLLRHPLRAAPHAATRAARAAPGPG
jgi:anti-sigma regulatory factor (Ser/Thr protein kinase)